MLGTKLPTHKSLEINYILNNTEETKMMETVGLPGTEENSPRGCTLVKQAYPFLSKVLHSYINHPSIH